MENKPTWLKVDSLQNAASDEVQKKAGITVDLPDNFKTVSAYQCGTCKLTFTSGQVEPQLKKAARAGQGYLECPKCSGYLKESSRVILRNTQKIVNRSERLIDKNVPIQRGINTWVDKAVYGRLVQGLANYIETLGISVPQIRFQRGIRGAKFPGEPMSAKAAEFTVEFVDYNNTRNRIVIQAGLDTNGRFIYPRTFKTLSGNEYPLNARTIEDFTSGKVYTPVTPDHAIPPLNYKASDPTRFREISANSRKLIKRAYDSFAPGSAQPLLQDENQIMEFIQNTMGITQMANPAEFDQIQTILRNKISNPMTQNTQNAHDNMGAVTPTDMGNNFNAGLALGKRAFQELMSEVPEMNDPKQAAIKNAIDQGLTFEESFEFVQQQTGFPLTLAEFDVAGQQITNEPPIVIADVAAKLMAQAEIHSSTRLYVTAESVKEDYNLNDLTFIEAQQWTDEYVDTFNSNVDKGTGTVEATKIALTAASNAVASYRIKLSLRDSNTLVPAVDPDPDYSLAQQTKDSESKFDMPYDETDGGITPFEERNISTMFREKVDAPTKDASNLSMKKNAMANLGDIFRKIISNPFDQELASKAHEIMRMPVDANQKLSMMEELENLLGPQQDDTPSLTTDDVFRTGNVKTAESTGIDLSPEEKGQNPMNYSRYKNMIQDYIRAGNIPPTKVDLHKLKDGGYTLKELKDLADSVKTNDSSSVYPTAHAALDHDKLRKGAEDKLADMIKEMPLEIAPESSESPLADVMDAGVPAVDVDDVDNDGEILEGGIGDNKDDLEFDPSELAKGIAIELEHIKEDKGLAEEIAKDHLTEIPDYYSRLENMESEAKNEKIARDMPSLMARLVSEADKKVQE